MPMTSGIEQAFKIFNCQFLAEASIPEKPALKIVWSTAEGLLRMSRGETILPWVAPEDPPAEKAQPWHL